MKEYLDTSLDEKFSEIESLKWLPFVGKNYFNQKVKTLIVGESHYVPADEDPEFYKDASWTRQFILKEGIQAKPWNLSSVKNNLIREMEKTILGEVNNDLWNSVAYFNLIQRLLPSISGNDRPTYDDIRNGLYNFKETVGLLAPDIIIFCGVEASKHFQNLLNSENFRIEEFKFGKEKINGSFPKSFELTLDNKKCICYFVKHPSMAYSANLWRDFIFGN